MSETSKAHKEKTLKKLNFALFICSTSRYRQISNGEKNVSDIGGDTLESLLKNTGHLVSIRRVILDDKTMITNAIKEVLDRPEIEAAIFSGGTGIAPTDVTIETVSPFFEKTLHGFGEFFRRISFDQIGSAAVLSRAAAGVAKGKVIFCIPGSPNAIKTAVETLILPEAPHIVKHARE